MEDCGSRQVDLKSFGRGRAEYVGMALGEGVPSALFFSVSSLFDVLRIISSDEKGGHARSVILTIATKIWLVSLGKLTIVAIRGCTFATMTSK